MWVVSFLLLLDDHILVDVIVVYVVVMVRDASAGVSALYFYG